jgi:valyl-tRNA synthetase
MATRRHTKTSSSNYASTDKRDTSETHDPSIDAQMQFYEKIAGYVQRHPEFVEELQRKMEEEEKSMYSSKNELNNEQYLGESDKDEPEEKGSLKNIFNLDSQRINLIADELAGLLFSKDKSSKSLLEKTVEDTFSNAVRNYLSKYAE